MALKELKGHDAFYLAIQSMLWKSYGINVDCIKEFYSFEDRNYYIQGSVKVAEALPETEFTLKIMNAEVSQNPDLYKQITMALIHLSKSNFSVPSPVKNIKGDYYFVDTLQDEVDSQKNLMILLKFLPGKSLIELKPNELSEPNFFQIVRQAARKVAEISKELTHCRYLDEKVLKRNDNPWKLENFTSDFVLPRLRFITNVNIRNLSKECLDQYQKKILPKLHFFKNAIINNDTNSGNIILHQSRINNKENSSLCWEYKGLIDFGEMTLSKYVFEVATFQAFLMISAQRRGYDIMHTADVALSGFEEIIKLNDEERSCLKLCNIARLIILISASGLVLSANETLSNVQIKLWYDEAIKLLLKVIQYQ